MRGKNTFLSILASAFAGAVIGVLFAPDKGERTRRELAKKGREFSKKGEDLADMAKDEFEDYLDYLRKKYQETRERSDELIKKGESVAEDLKGKFK